MSTLQEDIEDFKQALNDLTEAIGIKRILIKLLNKITEVLK